MLLKLIEEKDFDTLRKWTSEYIEENGGNGAQEIRNWLVLLGALQEFDSTVAFYEPIPEWVTGMAIVQFIATKDKDQVKKSSEQDLSISN